jgi:hypothetical protein
MQHMSSTNALCVYITRIETCMPCFDSEGNAVVEGATISSATISIQQCIKRCVCVCVCAMTTCYTQLSSSSCVPLQSATAHSQSNNVRFTNSTCYALLHTPFNNCCLQHTTSIALSISTMPCSNDAALTASAVLQ